MSVETVASSAIISDNEVYRYRLTRELAGKVIIPEGLEEKHCSCKLGACMVHGRQREDFLQRHSRWLPPKPLRLGSWWPADVPVSNSGAVLGVLMVNPSKANHLINDPTVTRILHFARDWGVRYINVGNEFARRATDVKELRAWDAERNEGPHNDQHVQAIAAECDLLLVGWGPRAKLPEHLRRHWKHTVDLTGGKPLYCLGVAQDGHPRHPLMVKADQQLERWSPP